MNPRINPFHIALIWGAAQALWLAILRDIALSWSCWVSPVWWGMIAAILLPKLSLYYRLRPVFGIPLVALIVSGAAYFTLLIPVFLWALLTEGIYAAGSVPLFGLFFYIAASLMLVHPALMLAASAATYILLKSRDPSEGNLPTSKPSAAEGPPRSRSASPW